MTKGVVQARRQKFIDLMIKVDGIPGMIQAYKTCYPACKSEGAARANAYKLLQDATISEAIDKGKREIAEQIKEAEKAERIRLAKESVAHESEIDAALSNIALGKHKRKKKIPIYNREKSAYEILTIDEEPTGAEMVAAGDKLYRRKGSYAPTSIKHEGGDTFIEFLKTIATVTNKKINKDV